ncbi:MAG: pyridoxal-phosphate dependent enzyme, partial [bacterium]|nr:pyridoxal-phosphate dependent enzyme [bacterium]
MLQAAPSAVASSDAAPPPLFPREGDALREYVDRILKARVYDVARVTPLERLAILSRQLGNDVLLKREDQQPVFSFKLRGAYNKIAALSPRQ